MENNIQKKDLEKKTIDKKRYYRARDLAEYMNCGVSTIWWLAKNREQFPKPKKLTPNLSVWDIQEINMYMKDL